mmetsp:Transcript_1918/g.2764  ORF Transcript_1918/g.2764 Transcript_1918/m.2764 type:complete len:135 (+) Transcript_1918:25-429(+)
MGCFSSKRDVEQRKLKRQCEDALIYQHGVSKKVLDQACESLWKSTDIDTDGGIDIKELERAVRKIFGKWHQELHIQDPFPSDEFVRERARCMMEKLDFDGDQMLNKKEFQLFTYATLEETLRRQKLAKAKKETS